MTTLQAIIFGMLLALTPSALFLTWVLWQEGGLPPHDQLGLPYRCFENTASDLIDCAGHINDEITTQQELVARLRLINSCGLILVAVGFTISMDRKPLVLEDDQEGQKGRSWRSNFLRGVTDMINTHWQFILLGVMALLLPSILVLVVLLWRPPRRDRQNRRMHQTIDSMKPASKKPDPWNWKDVGGFLV